MECGLCLCQTSIILLLGHIYRVEFDEKAKLKYKHIYKFQKKTTQWKCMRAETISLCVSPYDRNAIIDQLRRT